MMFSSLYELYLFLFIFGHFGYLHFCFSSLFVLFLCLLTRVFSRLIERDSRMLTKRTTFFKEHPTITAKTECINASLQISSKLEFWAVNKSWTFCTDCNLLHRINLLPSYRRTNTQSTTSSCPCSKERYIVPRFLLILLLFIN